jgi:general secretion pathway protein C
MAVDKLLLRHFWAVILALVAVAALLGAQGMTQIVGVSLAVTEAELTAAPPTARLQPSPSPESPHTTNGQPILARNPFDSVTGPLDALAVPLPNEAAKGTAPDLSNPMSAPDCDGVRVLVIAASDDPDWSFAAFETDKGKSILRMRGGDVSGRIVKFIGWDRVWLTSGNQLCQSPMFTAVQTAGSMDSGAHPVVGDAGAAAVSAEFENDIQKLTVMQFKVDRGVVVEKW